MKQLEMVQMEELQGVQVIVGGQVLPVVLAFWGWHFYFLTQLLALL